MRPLLDLYAQQLKTSLAAMLQYRAALAIWLIGNVLDPVIYLVVWSTVSRASGGSIGGFTTPEFAAYYIALMLVNQATHTWIMFEFDYRVRQGALSASLLRPVHPVHSDVADNLSSKAISLPLMLLAAGALALAFKPAFHLVPWAAAAFVPALALAFLVRFVVEWTLALAAFWTTRVSAMNQAYFVAALFLSGQIAPLALLPAPLRAVAAVLPFRWTISFPVELVLGRLAPGQALAGFGAQVTWLAAGLVILRIVWRAGVRKYSAVGT